MNSSFSKMATMPLLTKEDPTLPEKIGPYKIERLFTKGGMSILYLASHISRKKPIIVKVLPPKFSKNQDLVNSFLKEAELITISKHPNIISIYDQGIWENGLYIAMEFIQGKSLRNFIQSKNISLRSALEIILQVAYALCHLHYLKIIHRDLKPENILITNSNEIKVIDFGISRLKDEEKEKQTSIVGTPIYMSPEQKNNPNNYSFQTDIYALGIITYELMTKKSNVQTLDLSDLNFDLKRILSKATNSDPHERYQHVSEFITDLSEHLNYLKKAN